MRATFVAGFLSILTVGLSSVAYSSEPHRLSYAAIDAELRQREIAAQLAPIKSRDDLQRYQTTTPASANPLSKLSPAGRQRFLDSLVFNDRGELAGFRYGDLEAELSVSEIYRILSLFGAQHTTSLMTKAKVVNKADLAIRAAPSLAAKGDYDGYSCVSRANCYQTPQYICMSGC